MAHQDITVVFVPGAWHLPDGYDAVIAYLHEAGYRTAKVYTPSVLKEGEAPVQSLEPDVAEIRKHLKREIDAGQKVIIVAHSYGGMPGSASVEGFDQVSLAAQGHTDGRGVVHVVYLAAFMILQGESLYGLMGGGPAPWVKVLEDRSTIVMTPAEVFYNDFESKVEVDRWAANLRRFSSDINLATLPYAPWKTTPATYLCCELDKAIPVEFQRFMVRRVIDERPADLRVVSWNCGHTPFGVKPLETSQLIRSAVGDVDRAPVKAAVVNVDEVSGAAAVAA